MQFSITDSFCCLRFPPVIRGVSLSLRRLSMVDAPFLSFVLDDERGREQACRDNRWWRGIDHWWWMRDRYNCVYIIKSDAVKVGLIGLYDLHPGSEAHAYLTLIIPGEQNRYRGYGKEACALLMGRLMKNRALREVRLTLIDPDEGTAIFWEKMGFIPFCKNDYRSTTHKEMSCLIGTSFCKTVYMRR
jgi:RimJ/RimL family protein N-acetyltransferase